MALKPIGQCLLSVVITCIRMKKHLMDRLHIFREWIRLSPFIFGQLPDQFFNGVRGCHSIF